MLSILSWNAPSDIPGRRINTMSWRLVCCNILGTNGHDERRMWPLCCVCSMRRVEYRTIWPRWLLDCRGLMVMASGWQSFDRQFKPYLRTFMAAPLRCGLGCRSRTDGRIHWSWAICKINIQNMLICKICKIFISLHGFAYCTYFAYEIYIAPHIETLQLCAQQSPWDQSNRNLTKIHQLITIHGWERMINMQNM